VVHSVHFKGEVPMKPLMVILAVSVFLANPVVARGEGVHSDTGQIVAADLGSVVVALEASGRRTLLLSGTTEVYDDVGRPFPAVGLGPGDSVREECSAVPGSGWVARRLTLVRPLWRAMERHRD
jgi:hypothetical protein